MRFSLHPGGDGMFLHQSKENGELDKINKMKIGDCLVHLPPLRPLVVSMGKQIGIECFGTRRSTVWVEHLGVDNDI